MKTLPLVLGLLAIGLLPLRADLAHDISQQAQPKGAGSLTNGDVYSQSLFNIFTQNGIEAYVIRFQWEQVKGLPPYQASFVVFRDSEGRYFGQQSTSLQAKWLSGTSPREWARSFYPNAFTQVQSATDNRYAVGYKTGGKSLATQ